MVGGGSEENNVTRFLFRSIPKKCHCGQVPAVIEGLKTNTGDAVRNRNTGQLIAVLKGISPDAGNAITNCDARQAGTTLEGS
jgi:hypothetical protein